MQLGLNDRLVDKVNESTLDLEGSFSPSPNDRSDGEEGRGGGGGMGSPGMNASRLFEEQVMAEEELLDRFIHSDAVARESLEHLRAVHEENIALRDRVTSCAESLSHAEAEVSRRGRLAGGPAGMPAGARSAFILALTLSNPLARPPA